MAEPTYYEVLGVSPAASPQEIKKRYRDLARQHHPDVAPSDAAAERFREINEAYRILSDVERRLFYDSELKLAAAWKAEQAAKAAANARPKSPPDSASEPGKQRGGSWQSTGRSTARPAANEGEEKRKSPVEVYLGQARSAFRRFRYREAESLCRQALRLDRRNVTAYELLGDIHRARGDQDQAVAMYSYALQLDRDNPGLRAKFDKLVGQPTGPTLAGHAAASRRSGRSDRAARRAPVSPIERKLANVRAVIGGVGGVLVASMVALVATSEYRLAQSFIYIEWSPVLLTALAAAGWLSAFVLAGNRRIGRFFDELTGVHHGTRTTIGVPTGALTIITSVISLPAGFALFVLFGVLNRGHSPSVAAAYAACAVIVGMFCLTLPASALYLLVSGGGVVFLAYLIGWFIGDLFR